MHKQGGEYGSRLHLGMPSWPPALRRRTCPCTRGRFKSSSPTLHPSALVVHPTSSPSTLDPTCRHPHRRRRQSPPLPPRRSHRSLGSGVLVCGRGYAPAQCQVMSILLWSGLPAKANYLDTVCFGSALVSHEPLRNRAFAPQNRQISLRGALPRTPLGLAPQTPVLQVVC